MATYDVIVVGLGYAGAMAAISAHDTGARVLVIEKGQTGGGISVCSAGGVRSASKAEDALAYLIATNAGTTPDDVLAVLAQGMTEVGEIITGLADAAGAIASQRPSPGNYPFAGHQTFGFVNIDAVAGFDAAAEFPAVRGAAAGARLFKVVLENVRQRAIDVRYGTRVDSLVVEHGRVTGVRTSGHDDSARGGVVLATGGFEGSPDLQRQFWPMGSVLSAAIRSNTGDGLRMAQSAGASLWHMWHYHGSYGFRHPDPGYPFGIRLKRLPDWLPGAAMREDVVMSWIVVDQSGRRFMNEYEPYMQDTGHRALERFDFVRQRGPGHPAVLIADAAGRVLYPLSAPTWHDGEVAARFAGQTPRTMDDAILRTFATLADLAGAFAIDPEVLQESVAAWNATVDNAAPDELGRPEFARAAVRTPPFSAAHVWPIVSNTQGGPAHDARQRVLDAQGRPIPGLYEAGEIGSVFGSIYMSGGNLAECFVGGRIAGREASALARSKGGSA